MTCISLIERAMPASLLRLWGVQHSSFTFPFPDWWWLVGEACRWCSTNQVQKPLQNIRPYVGSGMSGCPGASARLSFHTPVTAWTADMRLLTQAAWMATNDHDTQFPELEPRIPKSRLVEVRMQSF